LFLESSLLKPRVPSWGKLTLATTLRTWSPDELAPFLSVISITFKYVGTTDPREFLWVDTIAMEIAEGGDPHMMMNWFPLALKAPASDWLLCLPRGSMRSWEDLCE
jgi:hypothetical protein